MRSHFLQDQPHRRCNLLTGEWVLVSPHRTKRPWQGLMEEPDAVDAVGYDPSCYLCPGNLRANGKRNPAYSSTYVFTNDFAALLPEQCAEPPLRQGVLRAEPESGLCRVVCYSPRHDLNLARMEPAAVTRIIEAWQREYADLGDRPEINHVQIFENRGLIMGCSNPHPHGQIWANHTIPVLPFTEGRSQEAHLQERDECLLCSYLATELAEEQRLVCVNRSFVALVPFWAVWPFETMILPRRHSGSIADLSHREKEDLAQVMIALGIRYDNLFATGFPYTMGVHQQPTDGDGHEHWHWHIHYLPPLLRSRSVKKHMVGYEMLAMPQRDLTAETAAARLRETSEVHYSVQT